MINKSLYKFCGNTKKFISFSVVSNAIKLIADIGFAYTFSYIIINLIDKEQFNFALLFIAVGIIILKIIMLKLAAFFNLKIIDEVKRKLRGIIYNEVLKTGVSYQDFFTTQEIIHLGVDGVEQLENYFAGYTVQLYYGFTASAILFLAIAPLDFTSAIILISASLAIPSSLQLIMNIVRKVQKKYWKKYNSVGNLFLDSLSGLTILKIFQADKTQAKRMVEQAESFRKQTMRVLAIQLNSIMVIDWIAYGSAAIVIALAVSKFATAQLSLFSVIIIILLVPEFFVPMRTLTSLFHIAMTGVVAGEEILRFLNVEKYKIGKGITLNENLEIKLSNFSYTYPDGTVALKHLNMKIQLNKFTAIVGHSGCGKTTIASVISQVLEKQRTLKAVRIIHQPFIFASTVRENLLLSKNNIDDEAIISVLKKLNLWEFLEKQQGLETLLLHDGKNISGGQAQRISIARALLANFSVYIFDEATSNIDVESEQIILNIIKEIAKTKTVIYISHKMRAIAEADCIYVMKKGKIVEFGTHSNLMENKNYYFDLYTQQEQLFNFNKNLNQNSGDINGN